MPFAALFLFQRPFRIAVVVAGVVPAYQLQLLAVPYQHAVNLHCFPGDPDGLFPEESVRKNEQTPDSV